MGLWILRSFIDPPLWCWLCLRKPMCSPAGGSAAFEGAVFTEVASTVWLWQWGKARLPVSMRTPFVWLRLFVFKRSECVEHQFVHLSFLVLLHLVPLNPLGWSLFVHLLLRVPMLPRWVRDAAVILQRLIGTPHVPGICGGRCRFMRPRCSFPFSVFVVVPILRPLS